MKNLGILYRFEIGKMLRRKILWAAVVAGLVLNLLALGLDSVGNYYIDGVKVDTNFHMNQIFKEDQLKLDGRLIDQELLEEMSDGYGKIPEDAVNGARHYIGTEEYQTYARPYSAIFNFARSAGNMTTSEAMEWDADEQELYQRRRQAVEESWEDNFLTDKEKSFWQEKENRLELPVAFRFKEGWWHLLDGAYTTGILLLFVAVVCLAGIFPEEHVRKTDQLILSSRYGREPVFRAKLLAGISFVTVFLLLMFGLEVLEIYFLYGWEGFDAAFQLIMPDFSYPLSTGGGVLIAFGMILFASILTGIFCMFLSELLHGSMGTLALISGMIIAGMFVSSLPERYRVLSQAWSYLPSHMTAVWNIFNCRTVLIFGKLLVSWQAVPILYLILGGVFATLLKRRYVNYQISGR
ncbi:MAG: YjgN family protein [Lachnospiraceae bacterium]|nr:YjgN family protein [Lachnospiraceae bacterium]